MILIAIAVLLWIVALVRLARWAASPALSPSLGAAIVLSSLAARVTLFNVPALSEWLDNVTSWPNLATLAQLLFLVSATAGAQIVVIGLIPEIRSPGRIVRHMLVLGLAVAVLVAVLFAATGRKGRISVYQYASEYSSDGWIAGAFLLTIGYGATGCVAITAISIRTLRRSGSRWRPQLLLLAIGGGLFACYALSRAALIWAGHVDKHWLFQPVFDAGSAIAAVACVLVVIGLTWESAGAVVRAWRYLKRSQALFAQIDLVAPDMAKQADRIAGWSVTRRAEARSVAILDFLTLITDTGSESSSVESFEVNNVPPIARAKKIADWLDLSLPRNQRRLRPHDLAPPPGWQAAAWVNLVLLQRPSNEESRLLHSLHP